LRRYFGAHSLALNHFDMVLRDSLFLRAISRSDSVTLVCSRRYMAIMSIVIARRIPPLEKAAEEVKRLAHIYFGTIRKTGSLSGRRQHR